MSENRRPHGDSHCSVQSALHAIGHLSVRLSYGSISQKRLKLGLCNFHRTVAPSRYFY